jgi:hypothetical protein
MKKCDIHKFKYFSLFNFMVTFFVINTKKVTKEKSRQTRSLRAFCLANATLFVNKNNSWRALREINKYYI